MTAEASVERKQLTEAQIFSPQKNVAHLSAFCHTDQACEISVVLPTMNEEQNAEELCQKLYGLSQSYPQLTEAIFVLNNTADGTEKVLEDISKRPGYEFLRITYSEGSRGSAIRRGVELARGNVVVVMDSDGQYDPAEIPRLVRPIVDEGYSIAIARNHGWANLQRRIISETFKKLTRTLLGVEYVQTGFKAGTKEALLDTIPRDVQGLDIDVRWMNNVVVKGYGQKVSCDVEVRLHPRLHGRTTFNPLKLSLGLLYTTISLTMQRKTGRELPFPRVLKELTLQPEGTHSRAPAK
ncbi:glycosyltransferase family 2 protein [Candidatus Bathyarchaeota archaeon]|nr:glycosyltransferase family 2 protein [Candidatus Bathyarchaeota archaeon]